MAMAIGMNAKIRLGIVSLPQEFRVLEPTAPIPFGIEAMAILGLSQGKAPPQGLFLTVLLSSDLFAH